LFFLYFVLHREHHWWIAYAKLNPPEGLCIFGIWSIYCYDCQWSIYCYDQFIVIVIVILVTLFLELLMKVIYAVKRLKLLHLIVCVFINTSLACSYVALLVFSMFTLNCDFNLCCVFFFTLRIVVLFSITHLLVVCN
jgi:hypothetical protein